MCYPSPNLHLRSLRLPLRCLSSCVCRPSSAAGGRQCCNVPTLQRLCEQTVARHMVEPRTALALLEFADAAGAQLLRQHSLAVSGHCFRIRSPAYIWLPARYPPSAAVALNGEMPSYLELMRVCMTTRLRSQIWMQSCWSREAPLRCCRSMCWHSWKRCSACRTPAPLPRPRQIVSEIGPHGVNLWEEICSLG